MNRLMLKSGALLCLLALCVASAWAGSEAEAEKKYLPIEELTSGFYNQYVTEKRYMLARTEGELEEIERLVGTSLDVDLERQMVVAAFMGTRNTGGYDIEVVRAVEGCSTIDVQVLLTSPGPGCPVTQAITSPYQVVALPRVDDKKLNIQERSHVNQCR